MKRLLSLPPNLVRPTGGGQTVFHQITGHPTEQFFCTCDPEGRRIGSGAGSAWLLYDCYRHEAAADLTFSQWLAREPRLLLHGGGQSRRLPAYAPSGKALMPIPVIRWERGQRLSQDLLSLQLPLYDALMSRAPRSLHTMIVSGDVLIRTSADLPAVPEADVVCFGLWLDATVASHHGVFVADRQTPDVLQCMLQKPSVERLQQLQNSHYYLTDIGVWLLSDRAVSLLMQRSGITSHFSPHTAQLTPYDLYSEFGAALGTRPTAPDADISQLSVAIVPLPGGEFYHFGTSREMIGSTLRLQNIINDQRQIMHHDRKPHPSIFVQNAVTGISFTAANRNVWIENSYIGPGWHITSDHIITGVPEIDCSVSLAEGQCIDVVPVGADEWVVRRYHIDDRFDGSEQQRRQFPVVGRDQLAAAISGHVPATARLLSAEDISSEANLQRLFAQRDQLRSRNWGQLATNWQHSVFYQLDLDDAADEFRRLSLPLPPPLPSSAPVLTRIQDAMFRGDSEQAFGLLRQTVISASMAHRQLPRRSVCRDQIVWGRSPVRIDISGGWTDTPPYCLMEGGRVVNMAVELNSQPPLQVYVKPSAEPVIILRSIDLGAQERITTFDELSQYNKVGSPFSIPKAALALAGFLPDFCQQRYASLHDQLLDFGGGLELTLLSAVPAGSGLGTSSILAATVLGALSDFCSLAWDKNEIGHRTMVLEQMLTTGGGWQDQFGGILSGVKLLQTEAGLTQSPVVRWLPTDVFTLPEYQPCHLLYYTGITRTAKQILAEIVRRMFLNQGDQLRLLRQMGRHAEAMYDAIQRHDFTLMGQHLRTNWQQNQQLDAGTNPAAVRQLTTLIDDLCLGYKLPGAGGGGFLYMVAKDPEAAARIRRLLTEHPQNANARFVDMTLSRHGLQVSRS